MIFIEPLRISLSDLKEVDIVHTNGSTVVKLTIITMKYHETVRKDFIFVITFLL